MKKSEGRIMKVFRQSMILIYIGMALLLFFSDAFSNISPSWRYVAGLLIFIYVIFRVYREFFTKNENEL